MVDLRFIIPRYNLKQKVIAILMNVVDDLLRKLDDMVKAHRRINIDGVAEELGIEHKRAQKLQSPAFFPEHFLKLIQRCDKCLNVLGT
ncbi:hypothetical protein TNCV_1479021 [Trichonephila clavipes]|nr:hypothetical protein TNCV_1479021 [Trichonephila clavipes]